MLRSLPAEVDFNAGASRSALASVASVRDLNASGYYLAFLGAVVARLWILPLRDGFWLDEQNGVGHSGPSEDVIARCNIWPSQSPAYSILEWFFFRLPGPRELMLRLPLFRRHGREPHTCCIVWQSAWWVLVRLGPAVIVFASIEPVAFAAADARPYAVAILQ